MGREGPWTWKFQAGLWQIVSHRNPIHRYISATSGESKNENYEHFENVAWHFEKIISDLHADFRV